MAMKVENCKNWCEENISPMAWPRVVLKVIPDVRDLGLTIKDLENPVPGMELDDSVFEKCNAALKGLYEMEFPQDILV